MINIAKLQKKIRKELDEERYQHTLAVMYTAAALAMRYQCGLTDIQVAGLLHDCAKCIPNDKKIRLCQKYNIPIRDIELRAPSLLHAKLGAYLAKEVYHVDNEEICSAIMWHTTGKPDMTMMEKIIFLADYIEPMRYKARNLDQIRYEAFTDIDHAVYLTLRDTLSYLGDNTDAMDENTLLAFEYYQDVIDGRNKTEETSPEKPQDIIAETAPNVIDEHSQSIIEENAQNTATE